MGEIPERSISFTADILPMLRKNCQACHNQSETEGDLILESPETILKGGDSGAVVIPGNADESLLFKLAAHRREPYMPPLDNDVSAKALTADELALLKFWIDQGAKIDDDQVKPAVSKMNWKPVISPTAPVFALDIDATGSVIAAGRGSELVLYHVATEKEVQRLVDPALDPVVASRQLPRGVAHLDIVQSVAFHPSGRQLASGGFRTVKLWEPLPFVASTQSLAQVTQGTAIARVSVGPDQQRLLLVFADRMELVSPQGQSQAEVSGTATHAAFLNSDWLVTQQGNQVALRRADNLQVRATFELAPDFVPTSLQGLPGGDHVALASPSTILIYQRDDASWRADPVQRIHVSDLVQMIPYAGESTKLLTAHNDGTLRVWLAVQGQEEAQWSSGTTIRSIEAFPSPAGNRLLSMAQDGTTKLWNLDSRTLIAELSRQAASLTEQASLTRTIGLRKEQQRIGKSDVEEGKKQKEEADKNLATSLEEVKKSEEERAKAQEAATKATAEFAQKESVVQEKGKARDQAIGKLTSLDEQLKTADEQAKANLQAERDTAQQEVTRLEAELKGATEELEKSKQAQGAAATAAMNAEKSVESAKLATVRAEELIQRTVNEFKSLEEIAQKHDQQVMAAESLWAEFQKSERALPADYSVVGVVPEQGLLWLTDQHRHLFAFSTLNGSLVRQLSGTFPGSLTLMFDQLVQIDGDQLRLWPLTESWHLVKVLGNPEDSSVLADRITSLQYSSDGKLLAVGGGEPSRSGNVQLWNTSDWSRLASLDSAHSDVVYDLAFSPQDPLLATCGSDRMMKVIDLQTLQPTKTFEGHTGHVLSVTWRGDGRSLATAGADKVVKVWDVKQGTQLKSMDGFKQEITAVRFLGLEDRIVFASGDGQVQSRNSNGEGRPGFGGYSDYVHRLSQSEDGRIVVAAGQDGIVRVWDAEGKVRVEFKPH